MVARLVRRAHAPGAGVAQGKAGVRLVQQEGRPQQVGVLRKAEAKMLHAFVCFVCSSLDSDFFSFAFLSLGYFSWKLFCLIFK